MDDRVFTNADGWMTVSLRTQLDDCVFTNADKQPPWMRDGGKEKMWNISLVKVGVRRVGAFIYSLST